MAAVLWRIRSGSVSITFDEIVNIIFNGDETNKVAYNVVWKIRLPRILLSSLLGGALSLSGY
ncbi:MAG: iron chelate uptake ABC transporter family permease subunit, partial [Ruminiclostridium sp.]|nr:iron chelate uptake ABC transporter family permease subunit [Ruminiclostridium sp.]